MTEEELKGIIHECGWLISTFDDDSWEIRQYSPAGEDFSFYVDGKDVEERISAIRDILNYFDINEHVKSVMDVPGAPRVSDLVEDAIEIQDMLFELCFAIYSKEY